METRYTKSFYNERGESLPAVLISMGILGITFMGFMSVTQQAQKAQSKTGVIRDVDSLRNYLGKSVSCTKTLRAYSSGCTDGEAVVGRDADGNIIFTDDAANPTSIGDKMKVRGICRTDGIEMQYANKETPDTWQDLYNGIRLQCHGPDQRAPTIR